MIKFKTLTDEQVDYIVKNYKNMTIKELSISLGKSESTISHATRRLGLIKQVHKEWTSEDIEYLRNNYDQKTSEEIAKVLNRTVHSINSECDRLGLIRNEKWSEEELRYIKDNFQKMTHEEIGKVLNRTTKAITAKCFDLNLYKKEFPWTIEEEEFVKQNYFEMKTAEIAKILNRTTNAIELRAHKFGLKKSPYSCNYHYFDNIDTEEKAYWLGFLTADGWISINTKANAGVTGIELQYGDIEHLRKFNKSISGNYKITDRWKFCPLSKYKDKKNHTCLVRIFSLSMYQSLVRLGFSDNKTYNCHIPKIKDELLRHYIRGYFDGDGCFSFGEKTFSVRFCMASENLKKDLLYILEGRNYSIYKYEYISQYDTQTYSFELSTTHDKVDFLNWIYKDSTIYLNRKYYKYLQVIEKYSEPNNCLAS